MNVMEKRRNLVPAYVLLFFLAAAFLFPILLVLVNSFKSRLYVSTQPFAWPKGEMFIGLENYIKGLSISGFVTAFLRSVWISLASVGLIILATSMTAWYLVRVKGKITKLLYFVFVFSMIVPFQMVMYTMTFVVNRFNFANIWGIVLVYLGFGAGLSVFMFTGFIKSIPLEIEEAAMIDGCNPLQTYFIVVFPMLKPTAITVAILQAMWVWNDYLLPYLILGSEHKTMPVAIQLAMNGAYGSTDYGAFMAMLVLSIIPIIVFYICSQKYIIKGVIAGAVKG